MVAAADVPVEQHRLGVPPTSSSTGPGTNYADAFTDFRDQIVRSFGYAGLATLICIVLAYPLAYVIAFARAATGTCCWAW